MTINIPLNRDGIYEFEYYLDYNDANNIKVIEFSGDDYFYLDNLQYFDSINVECDSIIDLYEQEVILYDKLYNAIEITEILIKHINEERFTKLANQMIECFKLAIRSKTFIEVDCYGNPISYSPKSEDK